MNSSQMMDLLEKSLKQVWTADYLLLQRIPNKYCINHRFAVYLEEFLEGIKKDEILYEIDLEYDKIFYARDNSVFDGHNNILIIKPDIIIHQRESQEHNLLAVEAKYDNLTSHDRDKLKQLLQQPYNYKYAVGIIYHPTLHYFEYEFYTSEDLNSHTIRIEKGIIGGLN